MRALLARIRAHLIDDLKTAWRYWSVRLHALAVVLAGVYELMPTLDPQIAAMLPAANQAKAIGAYALAGLLLRLVKQKTPANG